MSKTEAIAAAEYATATARYWRWTAATAAAAGTVGVLGLGSLIFPKKMEAAYNSLSDYKAMIRGS